MTRLEEMAKAAWDRDSPGQWDKNRRHFQKLRVGDMRAAVERLLEIELARVRLNEHSPVGAYLQSILSESP